MAVWITQLVVHKDMRSKGLATEILSKSWTRDNIAWGLVSSHPHAVRALERAVQRICIPQIISKYATDLIKDCEIPYILNCEISITGSQSVIHSKFFVDHNEVNELLKKEKNWGLGKIDEGDEFFAFVFKYQ